MNLNNQLRSQAKLDSRRFGKSIVCRIVYGQLLSFIEQQGMAPAGVFFNNTSGLDPVNNKMFVIPVTKYDEVHRLFVERNTALAEAVKVKDIELADKISRAQESLLTAIKQNLVFITIDFGSVPESKKAGPEPEGYDVLIDSTDVNQNIKGEYVYRNVGAMRETYSWYQPPPPKS